MARRGRGHLSTIDQLPEEADHIVTWAIQELGQGKRFQKDIHVEFNDKLAALNMGIEPISASAFNRHSMATADLARRHEEVRSMTAALTERMNPEDTDAVTIMIGETIKTLIFEVLTQGEKISPKGALELSRALQAIISAQKVPMERKRAQFAAFEEQVDDTLEKIAGEPGMTKDRISEIRKGVLGQKG